MATLERKQAAQASKSLNLVLLTSLCGKGKLTTWQAIQSFEIINKTSTLEGQDRLRLLLGKLMRSPIDQEPES